MCLQPRTILNRSHHFDETKPQYLVVPCGRCDECRRKKQNEWFVRCFYEWHSNPHRTYFYTLTYNQEHLPKYLGVPHFSKRDIQLFIKRLRYELSGYGCKLRYMICSEFGELYHRPHYHALFYISEDIHPARFYKIVEKSWQNGFVKYGDNMGRVISTSGISYVTKYVTKDMSHVDLLFPKLAAKVYQRYDALLNYINYRWCKNSCGIDLDFCK